jgi:hypothetical protein
MPDFTSSTVEIHSGYGAQTLMRSLVMEKIANILITCAAEICLMRHGVTGLHALNVVMLTVIEDVVPMNEAPMHQTAI